MHWLQFTFASKLSGQDVREDTQCAAYVTEFESHSVNIALSAVQGIVAFLSTVGSVLLILSYVVLSRLRTKSRLLIAHLAAANFLQALPNFLAVFMDFREKFKFNSGAGISPTNGTIIINISDVTASLTCSGEEHLFNSNIHNYCGLCVYLQFFSLLGILATIFWTICVCVHYFILVFYWDRQLASQVACIYYVTAWPISLGICLWLLFHNWLGFELTYSTVSCGIRTSCVPNHHPYHYQQSYNADNWNRIIGVVFGLKIWQLLAFLVIPCLFVAIQCKNRKNRTQYRFYTKIGSSAIIREIERKILLIPIIFMILCTASFVSDLYFYINHKKNLGNLQSSNEIIIIVHFLSRIFDNAQGVINFCLFCLFTREVRVAAKVTIQQAYRRRFTNSLDNSSGGGNSTSVPHIKWFTSSTTNASTSRYSTLAKSQEAEKNPPLPPQNNLV